MPQDEHRNTPPRHAEPRICVVARTRALGEALAETIAKRQRIEVAVADPRKLFDRQEAVEVDAVLVDVAGPEGPQDLANVAALAGAAPVLAIGVPPVEAAVIACAEAGASALVPEDAPLDDVIAAALNAAAPDAAGGMAVSEILLRRLRDTPPALPDARAQRLTRREREVLELVTSDLSNKEIAAELHLTLPTVKNHVQSILKTLGVRRRTQAAEWFRRSTQN